jgi:hypothetical protein
MAVIKNQSKNNKYLQECAEIGPLHPAGGTENWMAPLENSLGLPQKVRVTIWFSPSTPKYIMKRSKNICLQKKPST